MLFIIKLISFISHKKVHRYFKRILYKCSNYQDHVYSGDEVLACCKVYDLLTVNLALVMMMRIFTHYLGLSTQRRSLQEITTASE